MPHAEVAVLEAPPGCQALQQSELVRQREERPRGTEVTAPEADVEDGAQEHHEGDDEHPAGGAAPEDLLHRVEGGP
jgi:hypothetical protein